MKRVMGLILSCIGLVACPQVGRNGVKSMPPPGKASVAYTCDLVSLGLAVDGIGEARTIYLSWLDGSSPSTSLVLVSDDGFASRDSSITLVLDNERHRVDQIRDAHGQALEFDLRSKFMSLEQALAQVHVKVGQMLLEAAPRALAESGSEDDAVLFSHEGISFDALRSQAVASVAQYGPLPRVVRSRGAPVCEFQGFLKGGP